MKKAISVFTAITVTLWLAGSFLVLPVKAAFADGDLAREADEFDVYIIKLVGAEKFKRLILNPDVFNMYGHLKWGDVQVVADGALADYAASELVREINDEKVYKLYPDGDVGTKKWVESLDCFNSQGFDWDSVYIINSFDRDSYTTASDTLCGGVVAEEEGELTLSLAADSPAVATIPKTANGITFMKVKVAGSGTISQLTLKRDGAGATSDFSNVYIYENGTRLTSGRTISSSTSKVTFISLSIAAPTTFDIVGDVAGTGANVNYFTIESADSVTADATVGGNFPLSGNPMALGGSDAGTMTVARTGATSANVTIGDKEIEISQFKVTANGSEGFNIKRIQLLNGGNVTNTLITNLKLKDNTGELAATADSIAENGYLSFVLDTPYYIKKGGNQIFRVYADIGAVRPDRTIILYLELGTDILAEGTTYGYGVTPTISSFDSTGDAVTITAKGGDLTLNKLGPNATKIGTDTDDTIFLEYTMAAAVDITIKSTALIFCHDEGGDGYNALTTTLGGGGDLEDVKIRDKDTGTVLIGPKDGSDIDEGTISACPGGVAGVYESFTDTFDISAGETLTLQIAGDIKVDNTNLSGQTLLATTDRIKFILYSYATWVGSSGDVAKMKYTGTTDAVDDAAIAPSGHLAGEEMTIETASLALTLAAYPSGGDATSDERVYIKGQSGVEAVGIIFTAGTASDITVNSITLHAYTIEVTGGTFVLGKDTNYVKDSIGSVYIYDSTTSALIPGSTAKGFTSGTNYEHVDYTGLNWVIPAGQDRTMLVKADISSAAPASASTADTWIAFDIDDADVDISAVDKDGNSVDASGDDQNGSGATVNFGIAERGSVTIAAATDTPDKSILVMGTSDNEVSKFKLTGANESWYFNKFSISLYDGSTEPDVNNRDNVSGAKLKYQTEAQWGSSDWTISSAKTFASLASLAFNFEGDARPYVPKDDYTYVSVLLSLKGYEGGYGAKSKQPIRISHIAGGSDSFKAYGAQSGYYLTDLAEPTYSDLNLHFVARSKPVFAKKAWSGGELEMARFSITAEGYDVVFDGLSDIEDIAASAALRFAVTASSTDNASIDLILYDWNNNIVASVDDYQQDSGDGFNGSVGSISFRFEERDATVPNGTTKEFHFDLGGGDIADFNKTDEYIYFELKNDDSNYGDLATGNMDFYERSVVWHDGTAEEGISGAGDPENRYGMPEDVLGIGLPITFRTLRGTGTP